MGHSRKNLRRDEGEKDKKEFVLTSPRVVVEDPFRDPQISTYSVTGTKVP